MSKLILFLVGAIAGAGGTLSWLLSGNPGPESSPVALGGAVPIAPTSDVSRPLVDELKVRLDELKVRFREAQAEGARAGDETEQRLRRELASYRRNPSGPAAP